MLVKVVRPTHIYITTVRLTHIIYHREESLSEQYTDLLICHCTKQDLVTHKYSLVPRLSCGGGGKRAWYTLFAHAPSSLGNLHTTPLH